MRPALRVLDAYSLIAYLEGEDGKDRMIEVFKAARDSGRGLLLCVVNWGEVYYITLREAAASGLTRSRISSQRSRYSLFRLIWSLRGRQQS